jgi:hypothetical protein
MFSYRYYFPDPHICRTHHGREITASGKTHKLRDVIYTMDSLEDKFKTKDFKHKMEKLAILEAYDRFLHDAYSHTPSAMPITECARKYNSMVNWVTQKWMAFGDSKDELNQKQAEVCDIIKIIR